MPGRRAGSQRCSQKRPVQRFGLLGRFKWSRSAQQPRGLAYERGQDGGRAGGAVAGGTHAQCSQQRRPGESARAKASMGNVKRRRRLRSPDWPRRLHCLPVRTVLKPLNAQDGRCQGASPTLTRALSSACRGQSTSGGLTTNWRIVVPLPACSASHASCPRSLPPPFFSLDSLFPL